MAGGKDQRGQATVELALILPLVVAFCLLVVQVGVIATDALLVHHAAREAARAAAVDPTPAAATAAARAATKLDPDRLDIELTGGTTRGDSITATARLRAATDVPLVGRLIGDIDLRAQVTMRVE